MTFSEFCSQHEVNPLERRELRFYLAFLRMKALWHWMMK